MYGQQFNFLGLDEAASSLSSSKVAILPIPYDQTVSYVVGTRNAPQAIIDASRYVELYDDELNKNSSKIGISTLNEIEPVMSGPEEMCKKIYEISSTIIEKNKFLVTLGGEHSVSIGVAKAHADKYSELTVLQFDAHADLRDSYMGTRFNHASVMRRISEDINIVQAGIRSLSEDEHSFLSEKKGSIFYARDIIGNKDWIDEMLSCLSGNIYITFDLDALDPSIMPAVGTPEPGGFLWYEILDVLKKVSDEKNIVGFDVVELSPIQGIVAPDFLTAKLVYKLIGYIHQ